jgi:Rps23 Pro-64 3,4-dihydroxylase Tpa1-like proline 4-hydroxylase
MHILPHPVKPTEIIGGAIAVFENFWKNPRETIEQVEAVCDDKNSEIKFNPAQTIKEQLSNNSETQSTRTNYNLSISNSGHINEVFRKINNEYSESIQTLVGTYVDMFDIHEPIFDHEGYDLLKYSGGQKYDAHYDGGSPSKRSVSVILYLNDDYTGGEIEFVNFGIKIKPKAGTFYIFPSGYAYRHIAHPVESGTKYAIVTWLHDME